MKQIILRHPYCGRIVECTNRGFGLLHSPMGKKMIHIRDHFGQRLNTMEGLEGRYCSFVIGGHPYRYLKEKIDWNESVVQWHLFDENDDVFDPDSYEKKRINILMSLDKKELLSFLSAKWYIKLWKNSKIKLYPQARLIIDEQQLDRILNNHLFNSSGLEELIQLLETICTSPWYGVRDYEREKIFKRFFYPKDWPLRVFLIKDFQSFNITNSIVWPFCSKTLEHYIRKVRTIAIDLESNKKSIFQIGWKNLEDVKICSNKQGLSKQELDNAINDCLLGQNSPCIVGHNLLFWDLPILQAHDVKFPEKSEYWDTLLASFILEPWKKSHALIVSKDAHRADADAKTCYDLFEKQIDRFSCCFNGINCDIRLLIDKLYENPTQLLKIKRRKYPSIQNEASSQVIIYPLSRIYEIAWHKGCHIELVAPENKIVDPILHPEVCYKVAQQRHTLSAKVVFIIVSDAKANNVEVRLSFLPRWLVDDETRSLLKEAHTEIFDNKHNNAQTIYLAEDLFKLDFSEIESKFANNDISVAYESEVAVIWQKMRSKSLREVDVRIAYPGVTENRTKRTLLPVQESDRTARWLLYEPPGLRSNDAAWFLLPNLPKWLHQKSSNKQIENGLRKIVQIPRWRNGNIRQLDLDRFFISPDTSNRHLYLSDVTHCVLNLLRAYKKDIFILVGMKWREEAEYMQSYFVKLSLSTQYHGSSLKYLERAHQQGYRVLACHLNDIKKYNQAAEQLGIKTLIIISEVPLHNWYALLHALEPNSNDTSTDVAVTDISDDETEYSELETEDFYKNKYSKLQVVFRGKDIQKVISKYLFCWLQGIVEHNTSLQNVLILDARLIDLHIANAIEISQCDIPFYSIEELLNANMQRIFYEICFPRRDKSLIPNKYEDYRLFLQENWGYEDFRPETQRFAIKKIIDTNSDILLRLPTGSGKSIIFQVPALLRSNYSGRLTVVITPLRALMQDQVEGLWQRHFTESVDYLSGERDAWLNYEVYQGVLDGRIRLLFVAPERFRVPKFVEALERRRQMDGGLEFLVFDEAHCISEWGYNFRPDYLFAAQYIAKWFKKKDLPGNPHRLILTSATITQRNRKDLENELELGPPGFYEDIPKNMPHPIQPFIEIESFCLNENNEAPSDEKFEKIIEIIEKLNLNESAAIIFVRRRKDCHRISDAINDYAAREHSKQKSLYALPFHAGLPEGVKQETYSLFKEGKINVLVCTKAFGMGMDIPHLHACIHHRPPTFIEDYLQEVGRIGRDEKKRIETGHERVTATLLYNQKDIERNLTILHDKTVKPPDLRDFFDFCLKKALFFKKVGKSLCIVPAKIRINETKKFDENQVTQCLFWLERMQVLQIEGQHPSFIDITFNPLSLKPYAEGNTVVSQIARHILSIVEETRTVVDKITNTSKESMQISEGIFGRIIKGLLYGVLALFSPSESLEDKDQNIDNSIVDNLKPNGSSINVSISISELMSRCGGITMDDLYIGLFELSKANALSIKKQFIVQKIGMPSEEEFWDLLQYAVKRFLKPMQGKIDIINRKQFKDELQNWYKNFLSEKIDDVETKFENTNESILLERRIEREVNRAIVASLRILRYIGAEIQETISKEGVAQYIWSIPKSNQSFLLRNSQEIIQAMQNLIDCISSHEPQFIQEQGMTFEVSLTDIMNDLEAEIRISKIKKLMKLLEVSGFYALDENLNDWVSIVTLNIQKSLEPYKAEISNRSHMQKIYDEMNEKNNLQELRAQAMVLFTIMPAENRKQFIDSYFECETADDIKNLIEDTIGDVDDDVIAENSMLQDILSQVRKEKFKEEIDRLIDKQLSICKAPFNQNLLVNAGPGTGKTHVLMMRCAHLIHVQHINPSEILVLAFNRAVVYEIKDRIRTLFKKLGYGSYVNKLDVTTFHSFALCYQNADELYEEDVINQAVHNFAEKMRNDENFARSVGEKYKAILVDEFQDMNEDFYTVVQSLFTHCRGGGMVIGDDDQDILTWNRRDWIKKYRQKCPLEAVEYFSAFFKTLKPKKDSLTLNYRSVPEIVKKANSIIEKASKEINFERMKNKFTLIAFRKEEGVVEKLDLSKYQNLINEALERKESVAVLCRSNRECRKVYEEIIGSGKIESQYIDLLGSEDFPLYQLRHSGALLDILRTRKDYEFVDEYIWDELLKEYSEFNLADYQDSKAYLNDLYKLVCEEVGRPRIRDLLSFIQEMRTSDVERLKAKFGLKPSSAKITIATVHKVKGLEYDTVLIMPSDESFPFSKEMKTLSQPEVIDSAEEVRLFYVAMTRARNRLYIGWKEREDSWFSCKKYEGKKDAYLYCLKGSPREVLVSWSAYNQQVKQGLQDYIESQVCIGDPLSLDGAYLYHNEQIVGRLSKKALRQLQSREAFPKLCVSNVIRYTCGRYFREKNPQHWESIDNTIKQKGWFYLVLVEEV